MTSAELALAVADIINTAALSPAPAAVRRFAPIKDLAAFGSVLNITVMPRRRRTVPVAKRKYQRTLGVDVVVQKVTEQDDAAVEAIDAYVDAIDNHLRKRAITGAIWAESASGNDEPYIPQHLRGMGLYTAVLQVDYTTYLND